MKWLRRNRTIAWIIDLVRDVWRESSDDGVGDSAAAISFFTLLAMPASALAFVTAMGSLEPLLGADVALDTQRAITDYVDETFSSATLSETIGGLFAQQRSGILTISVAVALYSISRSFAGLVRALDVVYDIGTSRSWIDLRATGLSIGLGTLGVGGLAVWVFYDLWPRGAMWGPLGALALITALGGWAATIFHIAPDHHTPWKWDVPGAVFTAVAWGALGRGYASYVQIIGDGNEAVGVVGAALLAFTLIYFMSIAMLYGAQINAVLSQRAGIAQPPRRLHHMWTRGASAQRLRGVIRRTVGHRSGR